MKFHLIFFRVLSCTVTFIILQTMFNKFTSQPEMIYIFKQMGMEPWGRYTSGSIDLFLAVLAVSPQTRILGITLSFFYLLVKLGFYLVLIKSVPQVSDSNPFILLIVALGSSTIYLGFHINYAKKYFRNLIN